MRRLLRPTAVLLALGLLGAVAACGDDDGNGNGAAADPDLAELDGETVEVAAVWTGTEEERFVEVLDALEEETGATVTYTATGDDIAAALGPRLAGGRPPDVAILPQPGLLRNYAEAGDLQPVEDVVGDVVDESYAEVWRELGSVDGELYGVWYKAANKSLVWYNVDVLDQAGVEPPEDWEGFLEAAQTLSDFGVEPISVGGADGWTLTDWFENVYLRTAGPDLYDQLAEHEIPWTHESVREALERLGEVFTDELLVGGRSGALQTDFNTSVTQVFAGEPAGAMVYEGDFVAGVITDDAGAELGTDADVFPFPSIDGEDGVVGGGDVAVLLQDTEGGRELMRFLASAQAGELWAEAGGFISPNQQVDLDVYPDEISRTIAEELAQAENFRFDLSDLVPTEFGGTPGRGLFQLFQDFLADPDDIDGITEQMEAEAAAAAD
jgi:alpha-glucoside transport system substrate-binding protein